MEDYDIGAAFKAIEDELIASMIRNLDHHRAMEDEEGFKWSQWQVEQLKALEDYKSKNKEKYGEHFKDINSQIDALIYLAREQGRMDQEIRILKAVKKGYKQREAQKRNADIYGKFFKVNDKKLDALIKATKEDFTKAEYAMLRMANDQYRKVIYNAQVYANAGGTTYEKAVDMATRDFLKAGINCVEYKNGARHTVKEYADMCIKTATKRAYLTGEGEKRKEWGISTVIMNKRGKACPLCVPFAGKILVDDVWSGGVPDGKHLLMSKAIEKGLYHPRCRDSHATYFEGISTSEGVKYTKEELKEIEEDYNREQRANYCRNQAERQERLGKYSLDSENKKIHNVRAAKWREKEEEYRQGLKKNSDDYDASEIVEKAKTKYDTLTRNIPPLSLEDIAEKSILDEVIDNAPIEFKNLIRNNENKILFAKTNAIGKWRHNIKEGIYINLEQDMQNETGYLSGVFHEIGHAIDRINGYRSNNGVFRKALEDDFSAFVKLYEKQYNLNKTEAYYNISKGLIETDPKKSYVLSDIFSGLTNNQCAGLYSHKNKYWKNPRKLEREAFANFFSVSIINKDGVDTIKSVFPNAYVEFLKIVGGCI